MKTRKHGNGLNHRQVIRFSNRLAAQAQQDNRELELDTTNAFIRGWQTACKYFAHELRKELRYQEEVQDYLQQIK